MESCAPANQFFRYYLLRGAIGSKKSWASTGQALYDYFSFLQAHELPWDDVDRGEEKTLLAGYRDYSFEVAKLARSTVRNRLLYVCEFYSFAQRQRWIETLPFGYETRRVMKSAGLLAHLDASGGRASVRDVMPRAHKDVFPAGTNSIRENEEANTSILVRLPSTLSLQVAADLALDPLATVEPRHRFRNPQIERVLIALDGERAAGFPSGPLYVESLALALTIQLLGGYKTARNRRDGLSAQKLRLVRRHIESHLGENLPLASLAAVAGLSVSHFGTLFKRTTGVPVHEYLIQRRVARARSLLLQRRLPASEVALEVSFAHQSHLARSMRRVLGFTPAQLVREG